MYKYRNVSNYDQSITNIGYVKAGEVIETEKVIENPNFKYEGTSEQVAEVPETVTETPETLTETETEEQL